MYLLRLNRLFSLHTAVFVSPQICTYSAIIRHMMTSTWSCAAPAIRLLSRRSSSRTAVSGLLRPVDAWAASDPAPSWVALGLLPLHTGDLVVARASSSLAPSCQSKQACSVPLDGTKLKPLSPWWRPLQGATKRRGRENSGLRKQPAVPPPRKGLTEKTPSFSQGQLEPQGPQRSWHWMLLSGRR